MTANEMRTRAVEYMTSRKGKNSYTQGAKRKYFFGYPDNQPGNTAQTGFSDCSSAVRKAIQAASGIDIGSNTSAQINNRTKKGKVVDSTNGYFPDESKLKIGDCLYFKGNKSHPLDVGHVEMYIGNGKCCGHGSGTGPKIRKISDYCQSRASKTKRYFMAVRWILDDEPTKEDATILREGMYDNADVKLLQLNLIALGYSVGEYGADGDFGTATRAAVQSFQANNGLTDTGEADEKTLAAIREQLEGLSDSDDTELPTLENTQNRVVIADGSWNVRTGAGVEYKSAGVVHGGDTLEKIDIGEWVPVLYNGEVRFVGRKAIKK